MRDSDEVQYGNKELEEEIKMPIIAKMPVPVLSDKVERLQPKQDLDIYYVKNKIAQTNQEKGSSSQERGSYQQWISNRNNNKILSGKTQQLNSQKEIHEGKERNNTHVIGSVIRATRNRKHYRSKHSLRKPELKNSEFEETNMEHFKTDEEWQPEEDWLVENLIVAQVKSRKSTLKKKSR